MAYSVNLKGTVSGVNTTGDSIATIAYVALRQGADYATGTDLSVQANLDAAVAATTSPILSYVSSTTPQKLVDYQSVGGATESWDSTTEGKPNGFFTMAVRVQEKRADNSFVWGPWCKGNTLIVGTVTTFAGASIPTDFIGKVAGAAASPAVGPNYVGLYMNGTNLQLKAAASTDSAMIVRTANYDGVAVKTYRSKFKIAAGTTGAVPLGIYTALAQAAPATAVTFNTYRSMWVEVWNPSGSIARFNLNYNSDGAGAQASPPQYDGTFDTTYYAQIEFTAAQFKLVLLAADGTTVLAATPWLDKTGVYGWALASGIHSVWAGKAYNNAQVGTLEIMEWVEA